MTESDRSRRTTEADEICAKAYAAAGGPETGAALIAVGGYGRRELAPYSDWDVVLVHEADVDLGELLVARSGERSKAFVGCRYLTGQRVDDALGLFERLHHLEFIVLEAADATRDRLQLLHESLERLRVGDLPGIDPALVAIAPRLDLVDVGLDLGLLVGQVVQGDPVVAGLVIELGARRGERSDLGQFGQRGALVAQLVGLGVEILQLQQLQLYRRLGLHLIPLTPRGNSTDRYTAC